MFNHNLPCVIIDAFVGMTVAHIQSCPHLDRVNLLHKAPRTQMVSIGLDGTK